MKSLMCFLITFLFLLSMAEAKKRKATAKDLQDAQKIMENLGADLKKIKLPNTVLEWRDSCGGGDAEVGDPEATLMFNAVTIQPMKFMGYSLGKEANITICDGKVHFVTSGVWPESIVFKKDGYECDSYIELDRKGHLCKCRLAKDTIVNGFTVPKGIEAVFRKGSFYVALFNARDDQRLKEYRPAFYKIENGKPIMQESEYFKCDFSADPDPTKYDDFKD